MKPDRVEHTTKKMRISSYGNDTIHAPPYAARSLQPTLQSDCSDAAAPSLAVVAEDVGMARAEAEWLIGFCSTSRPTDSIGM